jgi:hypothetical protein
MYGNNITSARIKTVLVPLTDTSISGRWYLPENPDLEKYNIVGLSVSFSGASGDITQNPPLYFGPDQAVILSKTQTLSRSSFLTLYCKDGTEMLANFPINPLYNDPTTNKPKIYPITGKISVRKSYIFIEGNKIPPANRVVVIWLNFYYI